MTNSSLDAFGTTQASPSSSVWQSLRAIVWADMLMRLRRPSTLVLLLLTCALAYSLLPDPATGRTFMQIQGQRVVYTSEAVAFGTMTLHSLMLVLLFGFYMVSNTIRRDIQARTGLIIAATRVQTWHYIVGKFAGNVVFLAVITLGYMMAIMAMFLLRGEGELKPLVFVTTYGIASLPAMVFVSVVAVVFETIPLLAGKLGSVAYFFVWMAVVISGAISQSGKETALPTEDGKHALAMIDFMDVSGLSFANAHILEQFGANGKPTGFSIGQMPFDTQQAPVRFDGVRLSARWLLPRLSSTVLALPLLALAALWFHRFDPVRVKMSVRSSKQSMAQALNHLLKPLTRVVGVLWHLHHRLPSGWSVVRFVSAEVLLLVSVSPLVLIATMGCVVAGIVADEASLRSVVLPAQFVVLALIVADVATRERSRGALGLVFTVPRVREFYVLLKWIVALVIGAVIVAVPVLRFMLSDAANALSLLVGMVFMVSLATSFGVMIGSPKPFLGVTMIFLYLVLNAHGTPPAMDVAGWFGTATGAVRMGYAALSLGLLALGELAYRWQLRQKL
jgi:hypothetical protein